MHLYIAGQDRSTDIGGELSQRAARHQGPASRWTSDDSALSLKKARNEDEYMARYCRLLRLRYALTTSDFPIPARPGAAGSLLRSIKGFLWKLLRYQHDRMAGQQNTVNELLVSALDFQRTGMQRTVARLEQRIRELETEQAIRRSREAP